MDTRPPELYGIVQFVARIRQLLVCLYSEQVLNSSHFVCECMCEGEEKVQLKMLLPFVKYSCISPVQSAPQYRFFFSDVKNVHLQAFPLDLTSTYPLSQG